MFLHHVWFILMVPVVGIGHVLVQETVAAPVGGLPAGGGGVRRQGIGVVGALLNFIVAFAVSKVTASPPLRVQEMVESIRQPAGAGAAVSH